MTPAELRYLLDAHSETLLTDIAATTLYCEEGTNICGNASLDFSTDDIVFLHEVYDNQIKLLASHRSCVASEWGDSHIIPAQRYHASRSHTSWSPE